MHPSTSADRRALPIRRGATALVALFVVLAAVVAALAVDDRNARLARDADETARATSAAAAASIDTAVALRQEQMSAVARAMLHDGTDDAELAEVATRLGLPFALVLDASEERMVAAFPVRELDARELLAAFPHFRRAVSGSPAAAPVSSDEGRVGASIVVPFVSDAGNRHLLSSVTWLSDADDTGLGEGVLGQLDALARSAQATLTLSTAAAQDAEGRTLAPQVVATSTHLPDDGARTTTASATSTAGLVVTVTAAVPVFLPTPLAALLALLLALVVIGAVLVLDRGWNLAVDAAEQAEGLARAREDFVATASFELRSPVTVIAGMLHTLTRAGDQLDDGARSQLLDRADAAADRLRLLVDDVMTVARLDHPFPRECARTLPVTDLVETALADSLLGERDDLVERVVPPGSTVHVGEQSGRRVLRNLLDHAARHGSAPFRVEAAGTPDGRVALSVAHHGPGLPVGAAPFRGPQERHRTRQDEEPGVGLRLVRQLCADMGASVAHEQVDGRTRFTVLLPAAEGSPTPQPLLRAPSTEQRTGALAAPRR